jgi:hypothetical protein
MAGVPRSTFNVDWVRKLKDLVDKWLLAALLVGAIVAAGYGLVAGAKVANGFPKNPALLGMLLSLAICGGALAVGAMGGFLFGLPRALTSGEVRELARLNNAANEAGTDAAEAKRLAGNGDETESRSEHFSAGGYGANTNLERISDWLTTIIVGIGLANLAALPQYIDNFGVRVDAMFAFGGHGFGIGAGLYFLIFGFLMTYISTRTKLMLIFTENETANKSVQGGALGRNLSNAVTVAASTSPVAPSTNPSPGGAGLASGADAMQGRAAATAPSKEDRLVLDKVMLQEKQSPEQLLALANASARTGEYAKALVLYQDHMRTAPFDAKVAVDYAGVLGMNGASALLENLKTEMQSRNVASDIARAEANFQLGMRTALQFNLYSGRYEDSVRIGELLVSDAVQQQDAWVRLWLACAYGQRHKSMKDRGADTADLNKTRDEVVAQVKHVIELQPDLRNYVETLYDPAKVKGDDNDLVSLYPDAKMDKLFEDSRGAKG